jgi:hypothetical protein
MLLRAQGIQATVEFRFSELRAAELLRDTQVELLRAKVAQARYAAGWVSQDEAALYATGKEKSDVPEPREMEEVDDTGAGAAGSAQPDPGATRATEEQIRELIEQIAREIFMADRQNGAYHGE